MSGAPTPDAGGAPSGRLYDAARDPAVAIRVYEPQDYDAVWALHREGVMATTPEYLDVYEHYEDDLRDIEHIYLGAGSNFWVAEAAGRLIGIAAIQRIDTETGRLRRMRVTASWRRRGVARILLETAERFCRQQGYRRIILDTTQHQKAAHKLYETAGFTRIGERTIGPFSIFDYAKDLRG